MMDYSQKQSKGLLYSDVENSVRNRPSLAGQLWGIDWEKILPQKVSEKFHVETTSFENFMNFVSEHYQDIYRNGINDHTTFKPERPHSSNYRKVYYKTVGDFFTFKEIATSKIVGVLAATVEDWRTYYIRSVGIMKEFQGRGIYTNFLDMLIKYLNSHGVDRLTTQISPSNLPSMNILNKHRFNVTSITNSEIYGSMITLTRFMNQQSELDFLDRFCMGIYPQLAGRPTTEF